MKHKKIHDKNKIGIINGLWANSSGKGGIIPIEAVFFPSSCFLDIKLTGLQGDVMKESMNVAKTLAWQLTPSFTRKKMICDFKETLLQGIHIHCPEGGVSKDGPSAGAAITIAIYSLLNNLYIPNNIAITGEIDLQGNITEIGSLEMKILGGIESDVTKFIFPKENMNDYNKFMIKYQEDEFIIEKIKNIEFEQVSTIHELIQIVF